MAQHRKSVDPTRKFLLNQFTKDYGTWQNADHRAAWRVAHSMSQGMFRIFELLRVMPPEYSKQFLLHQISMAAIVDAYKTLHEEHRHHYRLTMPDARTISVLIVSM